MAAPSLPGPSGNGQAMEVGQRRSGEVTLSRGTVCIEVDAAGALWQCTAGILGL